MSNELEKQEIIFFEHNVEGIWNAVHTLYCSDYLYCSNSLIIQDEEDK